MWNISWKNRELASIVSQIMFILNSHFIYKNYHQYSNFVNVYNYNETLEITFWYVDGCRQKKVVLKKDWEKWYCNMRIIISWNFFCWPLSDKSLQNETSVNLEVKNVNFCLSTNMYRMCYLWFLNSGLLFWFQFQFKWV